MNRQTACASSNATKALDGCLIEAVAHPAACLIMIPSSSHWKRIQLFVFFKILFCQHRIKKQTKTTNNWIDVISGSFGDRLVEQNEPTTSFLCWFLMLSPCLCGFCGVFSTETINLICKSQTRERCIHMWMYPADTPQDFLYWDMQSWIILHGKVVFIISSFVAQTTIVCPWVMNACILHTWEDKGFHWVKLFFILTDLMSANHIKDLWRHRIGLTQLQLNSVCFLKIVWCGSAPFDSKMFALWAINL